MKTVMKTVMKTAISLLLFLACLSAINACTHRISIEGLGEIRSESSERDCHWREGACEFIILSDYQEGYTAIPGLGFAFDEWINCQMAEGSLCRFDVADDTVVEHWGKRYGSSAVFREHTKRVSVSTFGNEGVGGNCFSRDAATNMDGRYIVFSSDASNLVRLDNNDFEDVFIHDTQLSTTEVISRGRFRDLPLLGTSSGASYRPEISADGNTVAFISEGLLENVEGQERDETLGSRHIYLHDRENGLKYRVTDNNYDLPDATGSTHQRDRFLDLSADGQQLVFSGSLGEGAFSQIYLFNRFDSSITVISVDDAGVGEGDADSKAPSISGDGRYIAFESEATNLAGGDDSGVQNVYLYDQETGLLSRVSNRDDSAEPQNAFAPDLNQDGRVLAYVRSVSEYNGITVARNELVVQNFNAEQTSRLPSSNASDEYVVASPIFESEFDIVRITTPKISADGSTVAFTMETNFAFARNDSALNYIYESFTYSLANESIRRISQLASSRSSIQDISGDGRHLIFSSIGDNHVVGDTNSVNDGTHSEYVLSARFSSKMFTTGTDVFDVNLDHL